MRKAIVLAASLIVITALAVHGGERAIVYPQSGASPDSLFDMGPALTPTQLDSAIQARMTVYKIPAVAAAIVIGDSIVWTRAYGFANAAQTVPVADTTVFRLASISKTFVATCILQLWENGYLDLDADVNQYLPFHISNPYFPDSIMTIRMLLAHVSSMDDPQIYDIVYGYDHPTPLGQWLNMVINDSNSFAINYYLNAAPGSVGKYSSLTYALMGLVVEHVAEMPFEQYCHDSIWVPLGMSETSWFLANLNVSNIAEPVYYALGQYQTRGHVGTPGYPPGQLKTSVIQLAHHLSAFIGHGAYKGARVLDSTTIDSVMTIQYPGTVPLADYGPIMQWGLGWYRRYFTPANQWFWGHEGEIVNGTRTFMYCRPEEKTGAIVLTNSTDYQHGPEAIHRIYDLVLDFSRDVDGDSVIAGYDICPDVYNPDQQFIDEDYDGYPDMCEPDVDHDGVLTGVDNCPSVPNPGQEDANLDGVGDACCCVVAVGNVDCDPGDGVDVGDLTALIDNLFINFTPLCCESEANCDGVGGVDVGDVTSLIDNLFINFTPLGGCQ